LLKLKHSGIESDADIEVWRSLNASDETLKKRKKILDAFLAKLSTPNPKPVKRAKVVKLSPPFEQGQLLAYSNTDGYYYAAVVTQAHRDTKGRNILHILNYRSTKKPTREQLLQSPLMVHTKDSSWPTDTMANPSIFRLHGFLFDKKGFTKSKLSFEVIGTVVFHKHGFYKDGLKSFADMTKYSWDILPGLAALNYESGKVDQPPALLHFYTEETSLSAVELETILKKWRKNEPASIYSLLLDPAQIDAWISRPAGYNNVWLNLLIKKLYSGNVFLTRNILRRIMGWWIEQLGQTLDGHFFNVDDYDATPEEGRTYYKKLSTIINDVEKGRISLKGKK
jgi:hypothetical protein